MTKEDKKMIKCDDCRKEIIGTHIYWEGKRRCWKCDEKFDEEEDERR